MDLRAPACDVIADILRQQRIKFGLTLADVEELSGVSDSMVSCIETKAVVSNNGAQPIP